MLTKTSTLAIDGGRPAVTGILPRFNTIGRREIQAATAAMRSGPLSGYLGGQRHGGYHVQALEEVWKATFGCSHAIAVNSATSGLLVACMAAGVKHRDVVLTTPFTMSATAAAPALLGANIVFGDIEHETFCLDKYDTAHSIITTNLFGHPSRLQELRNFCDDCNMILIEDNAQSIFAKESGRYAGTVGHIGVFSLNVHKHLQSGEGGICVTDNEDLADRMRLARNHGEMAGGQVGLNLRMTEVTAAIALAQLQKAEFIVSDRIATAEYLTHSVKDIPWLTPPVVREGCTHSYYIWALKLDSGKRRKLFVEAMNAEGVPLREGYVDPLYRLPAFERFRKVSCPVAEHMQNFYLVTYENCAYTPAIKQMKQIRTAFEKVAEHADKWT